MLLSCTENVATLYVQISSTCNPSVKCWEGKKNTPTFNCLACVWTLPLCVHLGHVLGTAVECWWLSSLKCSKMFLWDISLIFSLIFYVMKVKPSYVLSHLIRFIRLKIFVSVPIELERTSGYFCDFSPFSNWLILLLCWWIHAACFWYHTMVWPTERSCNAHCCSSG